MARYLFSLKNHQVWASCAQGYMTTYMLRVYSTLTDLVACSQTHSTGRQSGMADGSVCLGYDIVHNNITNITTNKSILDVNTPDFSHPSLLYTQFETDMQPCVTK